MTNENVGYYLNICRMQNKMRCSPTQSGTPGHPNTHRYTHTDTHIWTHTHTHTHTHTNNSTCLYEHRRLHTRHTHKRRSVARVCRLSQGERHTKSIRDTHTHTHTHRHTHTHTHTHRHTDT